MELIRSSPDFCPAHVRAKREKDARGPNPDGTFKYIYDNDGFQEGVAKVRLNNMPRISCEMYASFTWVLNVEISLVLRLLNKPLQYIFL